MTGPTHPPKSSVEHQNQDLERTDPEYEVYSYQDPESID
jgi:hypothetical protein